jgi:hypothetical protein
LEKLLAGIGIFDLRIYGIRAGYEDQLVADRSPDGDDLASQPTLSRFENAISIQSLKRLTAAS